MVENRVRGTNGGKEKLEIFVPITILPGWKEGKPKEDFEENAVEYYRERDESVVNENTEITYRVASDAVGPHVEQYHEKSLAAIPHSREAHDADGEGYDAIRLPCFSEPGFDAARELCETLVMGGPCATLHVASMLGSKFSIITCGYGHSHNKINNIVKKYGLESRLASIRQLDVPPTGMNPTQLSESELDEMQSKALAEARSAIDDDGADVIIAYSGSYKYLNEKLNVPVIDPITTNIKITEALAELGLTHSKHSHPEPRIAHTYYLSTEPT